MEQKKNAQIQNNYGNDGQHEQEYGNFVEDGGNYSH